MKKQIAMLLALVMVFCLGACGGRAQNPAETQAETAHLGSVYYLNPHPEAHDSWQELAAAYTAQTGVEVTVVTAEAGTYADLLASEMAQSRMPTLFHCANARDLLRWGDSCLDLTGTQVAGQLTTEAYNLYDTQGALKALGFCCQAYGLIVNVALLEQAGYGLTDITNFSALKAIAEDIHSRATRLGFDAFCTAGLKNLFSPRFSGYLTNAALYYEWAREGYTAPPAEISGDTLELMRNLWDLYLFNSPTAPETLAAIPEEEGLTQFIQGQAVFYQGGSWEYETLAVVQELQTAMIPLYCGAEGEDQAGLSLGTENHWAVNARASQADIQATLDFLNWVVTSEEGTAMLCDQWDAVPFRQARKHSNSFLLAAEESLAQGNYAVTWDAMLAAPNPESWRATIVTALRAYCADPTDASWRQVAAAVTEGWAYEYAMERS